MFDISSLPRRLGVVALTLITMLAPLAASAQDVPSYARPGYSGADETIHGRIRSVDGAFNITVDDDRGFVDSVQLHQGTIINPTGLSLAEGMSVTILGVNSGSSFSANEIDTPYSYSGPLPTPVYYGPGYWCPGFGYGYGPSFNLAIIIGGDERPWYYEHRPFYGRPWDGHGYFGGYVGVSPENRGRIEERRTFTNPALRSETGLRTNVRTPISHVPPAFAGRTFAGDSRVGDGERFSTETNRPTTIRSLPGDARNSYRPQTRTVPSDARNNYLPQSRSLPSDARSTYRPEMQNRGVEAGNTYSRGATPSLGSAPPAGYGGATRSTGGGGAPHASAPHASGGGGDHRH